MTASRVVLVRPWTDAHGGTGCCSGDVRDGICLERSGLPSAASHPAHDDEVQVVAAAYLRLREELPEVDVQIVGAQNTAYLVPRVFRDVRRRRGVLAAARAASTATTAGAVLVDGELVGRVVDLGADGVLREVRDRIPVTG